MTESWLQEYNTAADRLQLIPTTAKRAGGMQFEARLNRGGSTFLEIMNVDLKVAKPIPDEQDPFHFSNPCLKWPF